MESEQVCAPKTSGFTWRTFGVAFGLHVALFLLILIIGLFTRQKKPDNDPKENIVPIDMTIVPPWAKKTDDPNPDPNPPPQREKKTKPKKQQKAEPVKKQVNVTSKTALTQVEDSKNKQKPSREPITKGKLMRTSPEPKKTSKAPEPKIEQPPDPKLQKIMENLKPGKGTAAEEPPKNIDWKKMLDQGYRYGTRTQIATSEGQRCVSLIADAIRREWDKETFTWHAELRPIEMKLQLGAGGVVRGFAIKSGSRDGNVDRTAQNALNRLKGRSIPGLTAQFIEQYPVLDFFMEPAASR